MSLRYVDLTCSEAQAISFHRHTHGPPILVVDDPSNGRQSLLYIHEAFERVLYDIKGRHGLGSKTRTLEITVGLVGFCQVRCPA